MACLTKDRLAGSTSGHDTSRCVPWTHRLVEKRSLAGDLAGLDAGGAHVQALGRAGNDRSNSLDVRVPATASADVRVRHVVAEARPLAANVADGSHGCLHN